MWSYSLSPLLAGSLARSLVKLPRLVSNLACNLKFRPLSCLSHPSSWNYTAVTTWLGLSQNIFQILGIDFHGITQPTLLLQVCSTPGKQQLEILASVLAVQLG